MVQNDGGSDQICLWQFDAPTRCAPGLDGFGRLCLEPPRMEEAEGRSKDDRQDDDVEQKKYRKGSSAFVSRIRWLSGLNRRSPNLFQWSLRALHKVDEEKAGLYLLGPLIELEWVWRCER